MKQRSINIILIFFSLGSILFSFFGNYTITSSLTNEDGVVENLTAFFYLIAFIYGLISILKKDFNWLLVTWTILCFIFLGEETSWFQRIFDFSVPAVENINAQGEFNLHNLNIIEGSRLSDGTPGLSYFLSSQNIFRLGFFGYFLILPLAYRLSFFKPILSAIGYKKYNNNFTIIIFFTFVLSFIFTLISPASLNSTLAETREMLYAFFIMIYVITYIMDKKKLSASFLSEFFIKNQSKFHNKDGKL